MYSLIVQLEQWGIGRVINCVAGHNVYTVHPDASLDVESRAAKTFDGIFGYKLNCDLSDFLSLLDGRRSVQDVIDDTESTMKDYILDIIVWLLRFVIYSGYTFKHVNVYHH